MKEHEDYGLDRLMQSALLLAAIRREGSFAAAAQALDLDPSSVSHRVRTLEDLFGLSLFARRTRRVRATRAGAFLCAAAAGSVEEMQRAIVAARAVGSGSGLRLSVTSSVAMKWLVSRLPDAADAGLDLSLDIREGLAPLDRPGVDAALRFGRGPYPGLHATRLAPCRLQPVIAAAHPAARSADGELPERVDLLGDAVAERDGTGITCNDYAGLTGRPEPLSRTETRFDRSDLMIQAAIGGLGIALGRTLLIEDDIRAGLLVPLGAPARTSSSYWLVTWPELADSESLTALRSWLSDQIGRMTHDA